MNPKSDSSSVPISGFASTERYRRAIQAFDDANAGDPNRETENGVEYPRELLYARRLSEWVRRLKPDGSEPLFLAARCQHLCRWEIPRSSYPADRPGYLRWRQELKHLHARKSGEILEGVGYDPTTIRRVQDLNLKKDLGKDADCQVIEDALCLVFLQFQLADLATRADEAKVVNALAKSWAKMSPQGHEAAKTLDFSPVERRLLERALSGGDDSARSR
ncbi:MAG: DUF4202 domain-containing protein [Verrucomicrobiales bacterium]|nr:DUF4202 domain-containing protein [Verrucomicrobiales bacterium]